MKKTKTPRPPSHLSLKARRWWLQVYQEFVVELHDQPKLTHAAECLDLNDKAEEVIRREGMSFFDKYGRPKLRPEVLAARDAKITHARLCRELHLDPAPAAPRVPRLAGTGG